MPTAKMSADPRLQQCHFRSQFMEPKQCSSQFEKIANLRRNLDGIKKERQRFLSENDTLKMVTQGLLIATLVKETCYSFLDLSAAIAEDAIETFGGPKAKPYVTKIKFVATSGMAAIDMSHAISQKAVGIGSWGGVTETAATSGVSVVGSLAKGPTQEAAAHAASQAVNLYGIGKAGISGNNKTALHGMEDLSFDHVSFLLQGIQNELPGAASQRIAALKVGTETLKAARRYNRALEQALADFQKNSDGARETRSRVVRQMDQIIQSIEKKLETAQREYQSCIDAGHS